MLDQGLADLVGGLREFIGNLATGAPRGFESIIDIVFGIWITLINLIPGVQASL